MKYIGTIGQLKKELGITTIQKENKEFIDIYYKGNLIGTYKTWLEVHQCLLTINHYVGLKEDLK